MLLSGVCYWVRIVYFSAGMFASYSLNIADEFIGLFSLRRCYSYDWAVCNFSVRVSTF